MKWSNFSYDDSRRVIKKLELRKTSANSRDEIYYFYIDGKPQLRVSMPNNHGGSGSLSTGFIKQIRANLRLDTRDFERLVECSLSAAKYEEHVRKALKLGS